MLTTFQRVVASAILLALGSPSMARAAPRAAILNLSADQKAGGAAAAALRDQLDETREVAVLTQGALARSLEAPLPAGGIAGPALKSARELMARSHRASREFRLRAALSHLISARGKLLAIDPTEESIAMLAELGFELALLHLREQNRGLALTELSLVARLRPSRPVLDPVRYPPDVIKTDREARARVKNAASASLVVSATFDGARIFVDGKPAGTTPGTLEVGAGRHLLTLSSPAYQPSNQILTLDSGEKREVVVDLTPRTAVQHAQLLRHNAMTSDPLDEAALLQAAEAVAGLTDAALVFVLNGEGETPVTQLLVTGQNKLSFAGEPLQLLALAVPVKTPQLLDIERPPPGEGRPWYRTPLGLSLAGAGTVGVASLLIFALSGSDDRPVNIGLEGFSQSPP
jgi:hypothetical protein